ncbi:hypothetical protein AB1683_004864 [Escherichia coli]
MRFQNLFSKFIMLIVSLAFSAAQAAPVSNSGISGVAPSATTQLVQKYDSTLATKSFSVTGSLKWYGVGSIPTQPVCIYVPRYLLRSTSGIVSMPLPSIAITNCTSTQATIKNIANTTFFPAAGSISVASVSVSNPDGTAAPLIAANTGTYWHVYAFAVGGADPHGRGVSYSFMLTTPQGTFSGQYLTSNSTCLSVFGGAGVIDIWGIGDCTLPVSRNAYSLTVYSRSYVNIACDITDSCDGSRGIDVTPIQILNSTLGMGVLIPSFSYNTAVGGNCSSGFRGAFYYQYVPGGGMAQMTPGVIYQQGVRGNGDAINFKYVPSRAYSPCNLIENITLTVSLP